MLTLYGIPNCDTVKKARRWLNDHGIDHHFHNFRTDGLEEALLHQWLTHIPLETLINRRGTSWRKLSDAEKSAAEKIDTAIPLLQANPSLIKRPVMDHHGHITVGFVPAQYEALLVSA